ncbi:nek2 [Symbiodinium sp. KB8]|nr:nek2 [Symbiodinium sp. KB8]
MSAETHVLNTFYGTPLYASPELCDNASYNEKTDIWSLGVVLYELAALRTPFDGKSLMALAKAISLAKYDPIPSSYSPGLARLIAVMLNPV